MSGVEVVAAASIVQAGLQICKRLLSKATYCYTHPLITPDGYSRYHLKTNTKLVSGIEPDCVGAILVSMFKSQFGNPGSLIVDAYQCNDMGELGSLAEVSQDSYILDFKSGENNASLAQAQVIISPDPDDGLVNVVCFKLELDFQLADQLSLESSGSISFFNTKSRQRIVRTATALKVEDVRRLNGFAQEQALIGIRDDMF